jgi:hypothetical protein
MDTPSTPSRLGFLAGQITVPDDFDRMRATELAALFGNEESTAAVTARTDSVLAELWDNEQGAAYDCL